MADPHPGLTRAVPAKAGEPATEDRLSDPVLNMASSADELIGGTDVGAVTPGNPVTAAQVPMGSGRAGFEAGAAGDDPPVDVVPVVPVPGPAPIVEALAVLVGRDPTAVAAARVAVVDATDGDPADDWGEEPDARAR